MIIVYLALPVPESQTVFRRVANCSISLFSGLPIVGESSRWQKQADSARKYVDFGNGESTKTKPIPLVPARS